MPAKSSCVVFAYSCSIASVISSTAACERGGDGRRAGSGCSRPERRRGGAGRGRRPCQVRWRAGRSWWGQHRGRRRGQVERRRGRVQRQRLGPRRRLERQTHLCRQLILPAVVGPRGAVEEQQQLVRLAHLRRVLGDQQLGPQHQLGQLHLKQGELEEGRNCLHHKRKVLYLSWRFLPPSNSTSSCLSEESGQMREVRRRPPSTSRLKYCKDFYSDKTFFCEPGLPELLAAGNILFYLEHPASANQILKASKLIPKIANFIYLLFAASFVLSFIVLFSDSPDQFGIKLECNSGNQ